MRVKPGQNMMDLAIQHSGTVESSFELALVNSKSLTDEPLAGEELKGVAVADQEMVDYLKLKKVEPATSN